VVQAPGGCRLAGAAFCANSRGILLPGSDGKTPAQRQKPGSRLATVRWFFRLADSRFLARVGNVQTATRIALWVALFLAALVVGVVQAIEHIATVWLALIAVGLFGLVFEGLLLVSRWRRSRRRATSGSSASVLGDIEHGQGCPRDPARMETWKQVREDTGIEYTVGKCNDCGRMAYRHGDIPISEPGGGTRPPRKPTLSPADQLGELYEEGRALRQRIARPSDATQMAGYQIRMMGGGLTSCQKTARDWTRRIRETLPVSFRPDFDQLPAVRPAHDLMPSLATMTEVALLDCVNAHLQFLSTTIQQVRGGGG
jgi:hypothetical protein